MENTINERIAHIISELRQKPKVFAESIGKTPTSIYTILNGRNKPGFDILEAILNTYSEISPDYLMKGRGDVFINSVAEETVKPESSEYLQEHLKTLEENFKRLAAQLESKDKQLESKDKQIDGLQRTADSLQRTVDTLLNSPTLREKSFNTPVSKTGKVIPLNSRIEEDKKK